MGQKDGPWGILLQTFGCTREKSQNYTLSSLLFQIPSLKNITHNLLQVSNLYVDTGLLESMYRLTYVSK